MECFKHDSFSPEKEIRWVDDLNSKGDLEVDYRPHKIGVMPFRKIAVGIHKISEIILGPQFPSQNIATFHKILKNYNKIKITQSMVTLR